jgi:hypothetical protein
MAKVARAFGQDLNTKEASSFMLAMASTLNKLENNVSATVASLLITMSDIGSEAMELGVPPHVIASWAALAQDMNMSANEAGTGIKRLMTGMIRYGENVSDIGVRLGIWADHQEYLNELNRDFSGTVMELAGGLAALESGVETIGLSYEALEKRGGNVLVKLVQSLRDAADDQDRYNEILREAEAAWSDYTDLMSEFNIMQENTSASVARLKNNLQVMSVAIGDDVLPAIEDFLSLVIPGIKALTELFVGLDDSTKRWILGAIAFIAVAGPMAFFINQVAFGFVMAAQGLFKMLAVIPATIKFLGLLLKSMLTLNPAALMLGFILYTVFTNIQDSAVGVVSSISNIFRNLANKFGKWGGEIFSAFADGIESAGSRIRKAVMRIINIFVAFFKAFSPPKEGPLSNIDVWGKNLFNTYLQGFENADFEILRNVADKVEGILTAFNFDAAGDSDLSRKAVVSGLLSFREDFAKLLADFRKFGEVSESAIDKLVKGFGNAADEIKDLIQATLRYEKLLIRIREIEEAKKKTLKTYKDEEQAIAGSTMSAEEQVELLADAQWIRDQSLSALEEEQRLLEEQAEAEKEKLEWQNSFMDALPRCKTKLT